MSAELSRCGTYRYTLTRRWGRGTGIATFVMLNPSTADATLDDPTIRRCVGFAKTWGLDGIYVVNLYALRATNPRDLWQHPDPVGPENDDWLADAAHAAAWTRMPLVAAWGANAKKDRVDQVLALPGMGSLTALGVTKAGQPKHPLYLRADSLLSTWPPERAS